MPQVEQWAADGAICGGTKRNLDFFSERVDWGDMTDAQRIVLCDSQTSGGLLIALPAEEAQEFVARLGQTMAGWSSVIGRILPGPDGRVVVR